ncbi:MAG: hypothetical protein ABR559_08600 [Gemmatimonadota bacterium]
MNAALLIWTAAVACGGAQTADEAVSQSAPPPHAPVVATAAEVQAEIEMLGYEIHDLAAILQAGIPRAAVPSDEPEPEDVLAAARSAHAEAVRAFERQAYPVAAESLASASAQVEHFKRLLGLAEEWGVEAEPPPVSGAPPPE